MSHSEAESRYINDIHRQLSEFFQEMGIPPRYAFMAMAQTMAGLGLANGMKCEEVISDAKTIIEFCYQAHEKKPF